MSQQASSSLEFKTLNSLNKNDITSIVIRFDELANMYRNKLVEFGTSITEQSSNEDKSTAITQLIAWSKIAEKLDPFVGNYETIEAKKRLEDILKRKVQFNHVTRINASNITSLTNGENPTFTIKTEGSTTPRAQDGRQDGDLQQKQYRSTPRTSTTGSSLSKWDSSHVEFRKRCSYMS